MALHTFVWGVLFDIFIYYFIDKCQLYSVLSKFKPPWKVEKVSPDLVKKVVKMIYITHEKGSKFPCPIWWKQ